jgi:hypothetical protein
MSDEKPHIVPTEGSNAIEHGGKQKRANVSDVLSNPYGHRELDQEAGHRLEHDKIATPDIDAENVADGSQDVPVNDGDETTGAPHTGAADEQATEYKRSI